jgi:hypothetical protein
MLKIRECHKLKVWPQYFRDIVSGIKKFEIRKDDRNFQVKDSLMLCEWSPETQEYTGLFVNFRIIYKLVGGQFGIEKGFCCLGIEPIKKAQQHTTDKGQNCTRCNGTKILQEPNPYAGEDCVF